ncbi:MAG TPA: methylmalonyl-CoA mutase family protein [Anaeromyxobacteraceae bacterium]|nr:methylmalonyl-CoA mutase family protein [Anaeromyxobacteraceae bacterium]
MGSKVAKSEVEFNGAEALPRPVPGDGRTRYASEEIERVLAEREAWTREELAEALAKLPRRREAFTTDSGIPIPDVLDPASCRDSDYLEEVGYPGRYPFTRGPQATMYRGRLWTVRQFAGYASPEDTNRRFKYLLAQGVTGLSTAFDMPTLMGYDPDHPMSRGEVGKEGVSIATLRDFEVLFEGIPLSKVSTSMTINASAIIGLAMYVAVGELQGVPRSKLAGTIQADMLKEYIAQKEWIVPPQPAVRIVCDLIEFCAREMPRFNPVSVSGYHIREAGATAVQELAFTLADGLEYVRECVQRGLDVDAFAPRLSFFWDVHSDFFEEVAKMRAARRIWARAMRERFGARRRESLLLRAHAQTAGVSLTAQQPYNNVVRTALQAFAAVLGGTQSLHTNSLDETYALPTEEAVTIALRTQQVIAHESGADRVADPLGGSYYVEYLTDEMEKRALEYMRRIDEKGGMIKAVEEGYPQREIAESAYRFQREFESGERVIVGVNAFRCDDEEPIRILKIDESVARAQVERLRAVKASRKASEVERTLSGVERAAREGANLVPPVIDAVKAYATLGEICQVFRTVFGSYREDGRF